MKLLLSQQVEERLAHSRSSLSASLPANNGLNLSN